MTSTELRAKCKEMGFEFNPNGGIWSKDDIMITIHAPINSLPEQAVLLDSWGANSYTPDEMFDLLQKIFKKK